jgi:hypothetical protein
LENEGTVQVDTRLLQFMAIDGGQYGNSGTIDVGSGRLAFNRESSSPFTLVNTGEIALAPDTSFAISLGSFDNQSTGVISGSGTLDISGISFTNNGTLRPGNPLGTLTIVGDLTQTPLSRIGIELGGREAGVTSDRLHVTGNLHLAGSLEVAKINGFQPVEGDEFDVVTYSSRSGELDQIVNLNHVAGFDTDVTSTHVKLLAHGLNPEEFFAADYAEFKSTTRSIFDNSLAALFNQLVLPLTSNASPVRTALSGASADVNVAEAGLFDPIVGQLTAAFGSIDGVNGKGQYYTHGDRLQRSDTLRSSRPLGTHRVKIGVIAPGAEGLTLAQEAGDIPANVRVFDQHGHQGGSGTAMLEILHDIAPDAELFIATAPSKPFETNRFFSDALDMLQFEVEADIIVSNVRAFDDRFVQSGMASNIRNLRGQSESGARSRPPTLYVQAAGDERLAHYESRFDPIATEAGGTGPIVHRFGVAPDLLALPITIPARAAGSIVMQWTGNRFFQSEHKLRLRLQDSDGNPLAENGVIDVLREVNPPDYRQTAVETLSIKNSSDVEQSLGLVVELLVQGSHELPTIEMFGLGGIEFGIITGNGLIGPASLDLSAVDTLLPDDILVVGAGADSDCVPTAAAEYSNEGPATVLTPTVAGNSASNSISVINTLDVIAPGVATVSTAGTGSTKFRGTAAAAAHVAGIAALLKQLKPDATPREIHNAIRDSAIDIAPSLYDQRSGFGRVDAVAAADRLLGNTVPGLPAPVDCPPVPLFPARPRESLDALPEFTVQVASGDDLAGFQQGTQPASFEAYSVHYANVPERSSSISAAWKFDAADAPGLAQFSPSGSLEVQLRPAIDVRIGKDRDGLFLDADSRVGAQLTGKFSAAGSAFDVFDVLIGGTVQLTPSISFRAADQDQDGRIRLDELAEQFTQLELRVGEIQADLHADLVMRFLDYVDIDPSVANTEHGGDPFVIRGTTRLRFNSDPVAAQQAGSSPSISNSGFQLENFTSVNPDINQDRVADYTAPRLLQNLLIFSESLLNGCGMPSYLTDVLGYETVAQPSDGTACQTTGLARLENRGRLPGFLPPTADADKARDGDPANPDDPGLREIIAGGAQTGIAPDPESIRSRLRDWFRKDATDAAEVGSVESRLDAVQPGAVPAITDDQQFEQQLIVAIGNWLDWRDSVARLELFPNEVIAPAPGESVPGELRVVTGIQEAIRRSRIRCETQTDAAEATRLGRNMLAWSQTAEFLAVATEDNRLTTSSVNGRCDRRDAARSRGNADLQFRDGHDVSAGG